MCFYSRFAGVFSAFLYCLVLVYTNGKKRFKNDFNAFVLRAEQTRPARYAMSATGSRLNPAAGSRRRGHPRPLEGIKKPAQKKSGFFKTLFQSHDARYSREAKSLKALKVAIVARVWL
jgi:hypothetical protein